MFYRGIFVAQSGNMFSLDCLSPMLFPVLPYSVGKSIFVKDGHPACCDSAQLPLDTLGHKTPPHNQTVGWYPESKSSVFTGSIHSKGEQSCPSKN